MVHNGAVWITIRCQLKLMAPTTLFNAAAMRSQFAMTQHGKCRVSAPPRDSLYTTVYKALLREPFTSQFRPAHHSKRVCNALLTLFKTITAPLTRRRRSPSFCANLTSRSAELTRKCDIPLVLHRRCMSALCDDKKKKEKISWFSVSRRSQCRDIEDVARLRPAVSLKRFLAPRFSSSIERTRRVTWRTFILLTHRRQLSLDGLPSQTLWHNVNAPTSLLSLFNPSAISDEQNRAFSKGSLAAINLSRSPRAARHANRQIEKRLFVVLQDYSRGNEVTPITGYCWPTHRSYRSRVIEIQWSLGWSKLSITIRRSSLDTFFFCLPNA